MTTIGYIDNADGNRVLKGFKMDSFCRGGQTVEMFAQKRTARIQEAFRELRHVGNITVYLINGSKKRKLFRRGM